MQEVGLSARKVGLFVSVKIVNRSASEMIDASDGDAFKSPARKTGLV